MALTLIEGRFRIVGAAPDGDSIRFYPHDKNDWNLVTGSQKVRANGQGGAQLRLDGIDALETHYAPAGGALGTLSQPHDLGRGAAAALLDFLGFSSVQRNNRETVTAATPDSVEGYILTRFSDRYGRVVAFAFKGKHPKKTGAQIYFEIEDLRKSANYHLLKEGYAYPTYYSKLFVDIRREMTAATRAAREAKKGIWAKDVSESGFMIDSLDDLGRRGYIMPKLFRRLADYLALADGNDVSLAGFKAYLESRDDRLYILSEEQITGFDYVVEVSNKTVKLTTRPENLVFQEK